MKVSLCGRVFGLDDQASALPLLRSRGLCRDVPGEEFFSGRYDITLAAETGWGLPEEGIRGVGCCTGPVYPEAQYPKAFSENSPNELEECCGVENVLKEM
jgi:hypothetical protein